jgi:hypothetical protein
MSIDSHKAARTSNWTGVCLLKPSYEQPPDRRGHNIPRVQDENGCGDCKMQKALGEFWSLRKANGAYLAKQMANDWQMHTRVLTD